MNALPLPFFTAHLSPHHPDVALRETSNNSQSDMPPLPRQIDSLDLFGNPSVKLKPDSNSDGLTDNPARKGQRGNPVFPHGPQMSLTILGVCLIPLLLRVALRLPQPIHLPNQAATDVKNDSTEK